MTSDTTEDRLLDADETRRFVNLSHPGLYKAIKRGTIPCPVYVLPRKPGWWLSELKAALELTRATPTEQMATRKAARDAKIIAERIAEAPQRGKAA